MQGLARSKALVLLQTKECLTRPWVLLELFEATRQRIPIIPVHLKGAGYDFDEAKAFLDDLETTLEAANPGAKKAIEDYLAASPPQDGHVGSPEQIRPSGDFTDVKAAAQAVTKLISVSLDPEGTENHLNAAVRDIVQKAERKAGRTAEREVVRV